MQENRQGVKRLLSAIYQNIDEQNIKVFAQILNYHESQLREDIEAIKFVEVIDKAKSN